MARLTHTKAGRSRLWFYRIPGVTIRLQEWLFRADVVSLSAEAQGVAIRVGWLIYALGAIDDDPFVVARLTMGSEITYADLWPDVKKLFEVMDDGKLTCQFWTEKRDIAFARTARALRGIEIREARKRERKTT